jgi:hypothetical protein
MMVTFVALRGVFCPFPSVYCCFITTLQYLNVRALSTSVVYYKFGHTDSWIVSQFLEGSQFLTGYAEDPITREVLMELGVPDKVTPEDVLAGLRSVVEKRLRLVRLHIEPLLRLLEKHGFDEGITMIEKAYHRDTLLRQEVDSAGRGIPKKVNLEGGKLFAERAVVPGHGIVSMQTMTPTHLRVLASIYRSACNVVEQIGGDSSLIAACREEATQLESYLVPQPGQTQEAPESENPT